MVIALLWLGLICCSVANWLICDYVRAPGNYYCMVAIGAINVVLLFHRHYTQPWCESKNKKNVGKVCLIGYIPPFRISAFLSLPLFLGSVQLFRDGAISSGMFIGSILLFVSFCIAMVRETGYSRDF